jgi:hypothetical protein
MTPAAVEVKQAVAAVSMPRVALYCYSAVAVPAEASSQGALARCVPESCLRLLEMMMLAGAPGAVRVAAAATAEGAVPVQVVLFVTAHLLLSCRLVRDWSGQAPAMAPPRLLAALNGV